MFDKKLLLGILFALTAIACSSLTNITRPDEDAPESPPTFPSSPTEAAAPTQDESSDAGTILFEDDFSDTGSGWDRFEDSEGSTDYHDDGYRILIGVESTYYWANPGRDFDDVRVEVDATLIGGELDNQLGIICRHQDIDNFYAVVISSDGYYAFRKRHLGADLEILGDGSFTQTDLITQGPDVTNHIRVDCIGDTISLYVNGQFVDDIQDSDIASGDVGLLAGTFDVSATSILFDDFVVYQP